jgi:O-methyltransferase involved in polyketide biosynthesis
MYLPADAQDRLFEQVTELSAPGSRVSAEAVAHRDESRRAEMRERFEKFADQLGFDRRIDIGELTYNDPDRSDLVEWLNAHGWTASGVPSVDEMRRLGRWVDIPMGDQPNAFATFVIGERLGSR